VEEGTAGRQCWHRCLLKPIKSEAHRWATVNYIHHNPVRHGYAKRWQDWPFSSATQYLSTMARSEVERIWREFPVRDMGTGWDVE
jgi:putative transposase